MRKTIYSLMGLSLFWSLHTYSAESWKGEPSQAIADVSGTAGLGIINGEAAFVFSGAFAGKVLHDGFIDDINDQVFAEFQMGAGFANGGSAFLYSVHLRWDFQQNETWRLFALAGLGGNNPSNELGGDFVIHPRVGLGAFYTLTDKLVLRLDLSHEFTTVGLNFAF